MNKRGVALIFGLLVVVVLSILLGSFFLSSMSENNLVRRHVASVRAFWAAEAGVAKAVQNLPSSPNNNNLDSYSRYEAATSARAIINGTQYYNITSVGIVSLPIGADVRRTVKVVAKGLAPTSTDKFGFSLQAANEICFSGGCKDDKASKYIVPLNGCPVTTANPTGLCWRDSDSGVNFSGMFGLSQSEVSAIATHYDEDHFPEPASGITWIDVSSGGLLHKSGGGGTGILIINGNCKFTGGFTFRGLIWVIGILDAALGNSSYYGAVVVSHDASADDDVSGSALFVYNQTDIQSAIGNLPSQKKVVSWWEGQAQ